MTFPRALIALLAILAATIGILLTVVVPASKLDIPNDRPAKYYPTGPITPPTKGGT